MDLLAAPQVHVTLAIAGVGLRRMVRGRWEYERVYQTGRLGAVAQANC